MKIIFYCGGFEPLGGIETFCKNLLSYLLTKNNECQLICWGKMSPLLQSIEQAKIKIHRISWRWGCRWNLPDWLLLPIGLPQVKQADIIIFSKLFPIKILRKLRLQASKKAKFVFITAYRPSEIYKNSDKKCVLAALNIFDLVLVQAPTFIEDLRQLGYYKHVVSVPLIPQKINIIKELPAKGELKIGFLGRLVEDKNIPLLLEAFRCFQDKYLQAFTCETKQNNKPTLHLFGDGLLYKQLKQMAEKLGIASDVTFYGSIPNSEIERAITSCHIFAFTSRREGQCLAALEILGCGRPIVATNIGALPEILSDLRLGKIVQSPNPNAFADTLIEMARLIDQQLISASTIHSAYLERYSPEKVGERYEEIINSLFNI